MTNREQIIKRIRGRHPSSIRACDKVSEIYRYRPFDRQLDLDPTKPGYLADVLRKGRLFIPLASTLNDPWEAAPAFACDWWRRDIGGQIAKFLMFLSPRDNGPDTFKALKEQTSRLGHDRVLEKMREQIFGFVQGYPVLSLSDRSDIFLMWSYYAKGHCGYTLAFDTSRNPFSQSIPVRYSRKHPRVMLSRRDMRGIATDVLATKARQWRHEREWRLIVPPSKPEKLGFITMRSAGENGFYGRVPKSALVGLILGDRLHQSHDRTSILDLVQNHRPGLPVWWARINRNRFQIDIERIT